MDDGLDAALLSGQMSPRDFVRRVASTGQLSVEQTSALWSVAGVVDENWVPDKTVTQPTSTTTPGSGGTSVTLPALSPAFIHADDAALWAHRRIGARRDREYGGVILRNLQGYFLPQSRSVVRGLSLTSATSSAPARMAVSCRLPVTAAPGFIIPIRRITNRLPVPTRRCPSIR